jgi:hypothetical protein
MSGQTLFGPVQITSTMPWSTTSGPLAFANPIAMHPEESRLLAIDVDIANTEDAPGQFSGDRHEYRLTIDDGAGHFFPFDAVRRIRDGSFVDPSEIETNVRIPGNVLRVVDSIRASLSPSTPPGMNIPRNAAGVAMFRFDVDLPATDSIFSNFRLHHVGTGPASDIENVFLYDASGMRLSPGRAVDPVTGMVTFNSVDYAVGPIHRSFTIECDFIASSAGGTHAFEIVDETAVAILGSAYRVTGSFPIRGNAFTIADRLAPRLEVRKGSQPANPIPGSADAVVSNFTVTAVGGDIGIQQTALYQSGSVSNADLTDFRLFYGPTVIASAHGVDERGHIVLLFSPRFVAINGRIMELSLHAHVGGRAGRTIRTNIEYPTDVLTTDPVYGTTSAVCMTSRLAGGCSATGQGYFDGTIPQYVEVTTL